MAALSFGAPTGQQQPPHHRQPSTFSTYGPPAKSPSPPRQLSGGAPSLTAPLPAIPTLSAALDTIQNPAHDPTQRIAWCRDVLLLVDRLQPASAAGGASAAAGTDPVTGPARITDPTLQRLALAAVPIVLQLASSAAAGQQMPPHVAEAVYLRATLANTGQFPDLVPRSPRTAFRDFELAARNGHHAAWFRLGREYESVNDAQHARDCFERGVKLNVESCLYRMGMAHLMGQLGLPANSTVAVPLLQRAATLATVACPQPAYVLGLLLLDEFSHVSIPPQTFASVLPPGSSREAEARRHLERAAYLNFAPAQYKLGHAYEFAQAPFPFDPLLSVQYYSLASQQGEIEADMALSKWFLCGAEGCFEKDEALAYTFAEKAARKGLPSAEFAMGYYAEVGVGGPKDMQAARKWYTRAADHGNADAKERLAALAQDQSLSRQEHDVLTENTLVRKRTQAKQRSDARPGAAPARTQQAAEGQRIVNVIRQNSLAQPPAPGPAPFPAPAAGPSSAHTSPSLAPAQVPPLGYQQRRPSHADTASPPAPLGATQGPEPRRPSHADTSPDPASFARPNPPRAHPNAHRYTLADPGFGSAPPPGAPGPGRAQSPGQGPPREQSPAFRPPGQRPGREQSATPGGQPQQRPNAGSPAPDRPKPAGPTTFAEMGIQSGKLEDKECIIM
ncbi:HCP-like protein [Punctularia strigosozonata HHB-11173 SS5]|uniref:HCP-like protein n=1 Tax=Punctularia strigosozonata (strain HHB-11173) TaxID=741275 RepID=UPI00044167D0|nr:HCP-like protein [Punctularia strigosozonata HHB-11173 SS5]EIN13641.1 HCP-like protein [Punctularia strigosozonata HHB-11173 SS5]